MSKNKYIFLITVITALAITGLLLLPDYLKPPNPERYVPWEPQFVIVFLLFNLITIFPAYKLHKKLSPDYTPIKNIFFFTIFGGVTGAMLGEGGNPVMILPYSVFMLVYAFFYKKYTWWKVALTSYLAGTLIESGMNRSPIQVTTLMWIAFFTYPYFFTKIYENRKNINYKNLILKTLLLLIASAVLGVAAFLFTINNPSPPLIFLGALLPFVIISFR